MSNWLIGRLLCWLFAFFGGWGRDGLVDCLVGERINCLIPFLSDLCLYSLMSFRLLLFIDCWMDRLIVRLIAID